MATNAIAGMLGSAAGGAASPLALGISSVSSLLSKALDFIPDPAKKLELQQHAMDIEAENHRQELLAVTEQVKASMQASAGDTSLWKERAFFCVMMTLLYVWNYAFCRFFHQQPIDFPGSLHVLFAAIMLGLTGAPAAFSALQNLMGMVPGVMQLPGESSVSVLGVKVGNKS